MTKFKSLILIIFSVFLFSCTSQEAEQIEAAINSERPEKELARYVRDKGREYRKDPNALAADIRRIPQMLDNLERIVERHWGKKFGRVSGRDKYVKYTNDYQSKAEVDFSKGLILVETIARDKPLESLKRAIVVTLLTSDDPSTTDIFSDKTPNISGTPYLLGEVIDQDGKAIRFEWRANRFADYLIKHHMNYREIGERLSHYVEIEMVRDHSQLRQQKYASIVLEASKKYKVAPDLIYAIMETESHFNPFAVSSANAYGLMQIIPATAGRDVYEKILKRPGMPSRDTLFDPKENIHIGTAYLHILQTRYLAKIKQAQSKHYAVISAYNGGAGNVFNTFSRDRNKAVDVINGITPWRVFRQLTTVHPKAESRRYLEKVTQAQKKY